MKIKLFKTDYSSYAEEDGGNSRDFLKGVTNWEEITNEQFATIQEYKKNYNFPYILVQQLTQEEINSTISEILLQLKKVHERQEKIKATYREQEADRASKAKALLESQKLQ